MKIARETPDQLILDDTPWLIGVALILFVLLFVGVGLALTLAGEPGGLVFVLLGGGIGGPFFCLFVKRRQAVFDRGRGEIALRRRSVFGYASETLPLARLTGAEIEETRDSKGHRTRRAVLTFSDGARRPLNDIYTNTSGPERACAAVNRWRVALDSGAPAS